MVSMKRVEGVFVGVVNWPETQEHARIVRGERGPRASLRATHPSGLTHTHASFTHICTYIGYDYPAVLTLALGFFNAQRSGHLPPANPVPWRGDSALGDAAAGRSLAGGFYDAGDHLKLHLPLAWSLSNLAWAMVAFPDAFPRGGDAARSAAATLKWGAAYLMACNLGAGRFVAQVGSEGADHGYWGRPEDMAMPRPVLVVDGPGGKPGSDVVGGAVAALAATAVALKHTDPAFASACVASARDLYGLATTYEGTYSSALPVGNLYPSSSYLDELAWAAAWLGRATSGEQPGGGSPTTAGTSAWFLVRARSYWGRAGAEHRGLANSLAHFWSETYAAAAVLLAADTGGPEYSAYLWRFAQAHVGGSWPLSYTPAGLSYRHQWGSLRMATGSATVIAAFGALLAPTDPGTARKFSCWARGQVRYALGDTGRSFVAGYGDRPPMRPHHRAASCPPFTPGTAGRNSPTCGHEAFVNPGPNPNVLTGALIGGPDAADAFVDARDDYVKCEVALDYQAAFVGALAGVVASGPGETWGACLAAFPGALRPIKRVGV